MFDANLHVASFPISQVIDKCNSELKKEVKQAEAAKRQTKIRWGTVVERLDIEVDAQTRKTLGLPDPAPGEENVYEYEVHEQADPFSKDAGCPSPTSSGSAPFTGAMMIEGSMEVNSPEDTASPGKPPETTSTYVMSCRLQGEMQSFEQVNRTHPLRYPPRTPKYSPLNRMPFVPL